MKLQAMAEMAAKYVNTTNQHIFLTGKAGTGKTTFLKHIIQNTHKHVVVAAPTGIAAINANGVTLHSLLQLPFGAFIPENVSMANSENRVTTPLTLFQNSKFNASKRQLIKTIELLIIDEVSMLRADLLDCIDHVLRHLRRSRKPFGGVQILFIGDLMQLPPVVKDEEKALLSQYYESLYFFKARALQTQPLVHIELQKIFRQQDQGFIELLNRLRHNKQTQEDLHFLNQYYDPDFNQSQEEGYIHLTTHNYRADKLNQHKLAMLESELYTFHAHIEETFPESMFPVSPELHLKLGAQVMFVKNDPSGERKYFNGKIGVISNISDEEVWVRFESGDEVLVEPYKWENTRYTLNNETNEIEEKFLGSFEHHPIKLAWAVTVHKSQGLTFEKAILDLSGTFAPGQFYVALSRLTSLKGLVLSSPLPVDPPGIDGSLSSFTNSSLTDEEISKRLGDDQRQFLIDFGKNAFDFGPLIRNFQYHIRSFNKSENRSLKQQYFSWTQGLISDISPLEKVGHTFVKEIGLITQNDSYLDQLIARISKAKAYFLDQLVPHFEKIQSHRKALSKEKKIKTYLKELEELQTQLLGMIGNIERMFFIVEALQQGKMPSKDQMSDSVFLKLSKTKGAPVKDKTPTYEITYAMFKEGKTIEEIAKARELVTGTIEGHLAQYVEKGEIQIADLVDEKRVEKIMKAIASDAVGLSEIKSQLPADYTYGEIKMVFAHSKFLNS